MENKALKPTILNLAGELQEEFRIYFEQRELKVHSPEETLEEGEWTHILVKDTQDFTSINETYQTVEKDIKLVSLSKVDETKAFVLANGKLVIDDLWMKGPLGAFILDKFFQEYAGTSMGDNYPRFEETGFFNITNPFSTGDYVDKMVFKAFEKDFAALSLKTYFDHITMYLAGLKKQGKIGMPIEVTYGAFDDVFGLQMHFFTDGLLLEDITNSLSSAIGRRAEEYLLNIAVNSADFLDFTFLAQVKKVVITALWSKDERVTVQNRGLMFTTLMSAATLTGVPYEGLTSQIMDSSEIGDVTEKINLPSETPAAEPVTTLGGLPAEEGIITVESHDEMSELVNLVKGSVEEQEQVIKISGSKLDPDDFVMKISSGIEEKKGAFAFKSLNGEKLPDTLKTGLFDFAKGLDKDVADLNESDIHVFKEQKVPELIKNHTIIKSAPSNDVDDKVIVKESKPLFQAPPNDNEKKLQLQLKAAQTEIENFKGKMKAMYTELKAVKDARNQLASIQAKAKEAADKEVLVVPDQDEQLRQHFQNKLGNDEALSILEQKKLKDLLEREAKLIETAKQEEMRARKLQIETTQKEALFQQELEKANRQIKSRDLVFSKTKESLTKLVEKKEAEIASMQHRMDALNMTLGAAPSQAQMTQLKDLEKQNQSLTKMVDMYKAKVTSLTAALQNNKSDDGVSKEEVRRLQMINQQLQNQINDGKKQIQKFQDKIAYDMNQLTALRGEKSKLEAMVKKFTADMKKDELAQKAGDHVENELKKSQLHNQTLESQLKDLTIRLKETETRLTEALKTQQKQNAGLDDNKKVAHLEASVKKLSADLLEAKNQSAEMKKETNKLRQEKTALQNQLDKIKKDAEKASKAAPKKPDSGGKAA